MYDGHVSSLNLIKYAKGISYYLQKDDGSPSIVPQYIIDKIQSLKQKDGTYLIDTSFYKLGDKVKIIKGQEVTTGDFANINLETNDYSIKSIDNKVKLLISSDD